MAPQVWHFSVDNDKIVFESSKDKGKYEVFSVQPQDDERVSIKLRSKFGKTSHDLLKCPISQYGGNDDAFFGELTLSVDSYDFVSTLKTLMDTDGLSFGDKGSESSTESEQTFPASPLLLSSTSSLQLQERSIFSTAITSSPATHLTDSQASSPQRAGSTQTTAAPTPLTAEPTQLEGESTPHQTTPQYASQLSSEPPTEFQDIVEQFRSLHPMADRNETQFLDIQERKWRRQCQKLLNITNTAKFAGSFKRHLYVASLSDRCFRLASIIMQKFKKGQLKEQLSNKVNQMLFYGAVGCRDETTVFEALENFKDKTFSKEEFNNFFKSMKERNKNEEAGLEEENKRLKEETIGLREENNKLRQELVIMRRRQEYMMQETKNLRLELQTAREKAKDVYDFDSEEDAEATVTEMVVNSRSRLSPPHQVGATVEVKFEDKWYIGKVLEVKGLKVKVHYRHWGPQFDEWVSVEVVRAKIDESSKFKVGETVLSKWMASRTTMYQACVKELVGDYLVLNFEDHTTKRIHARNVKKLD